METLEQALVLQRDDILNYFMKKIIIINKDHVKVKQRLIVGKPVQMGT